MASSSRSIQDFLESINDALQTLCRRHQISTEEGIHALFDHFFQDDAEDECFELPSNRGSKRKPGYVQETEAKKSSSESPVRAIKFQFHPQDPRRNMVPLQPVTTIKPQLAGKPQPANKPQPARQQPQPSTSQDNATRGPPGGNKDLAPLIVPRVQDVPKFIEEVRNKTGAKAFQLLSNNQVKVRLIDPLHRDDVFAAIEETNHRWFSFPSKKEKLKRLVLKRLPDSDEAEILADLLTMGCKALSVLKLRLKPKGVGYYAATSAQFTWCLLAMTLTCRMLGR